MKSPIFIKDRILAIPLVSALTIRGFGDFQIVTERYSSLSIKMYFKEHPDTCSFAIVGNENDRNEFSNSFPNNFVVMDYEGDAMDIVAKNIIYILTNFGRDNSADSRTWFTSDTHFWHQNIIKYCNRPWKTAEEMNDGMVERWNSVVGKYDTVFHLGDFSFGNRAKVESVFNRLNGKINLIMGNHDRLEVSEYYDIGFHRVYDRPIVYRDFFLLSHAPLQWVENGGVYANIYGHVHDMAVYNTFTANSCCACVERHEYRPISFTEVKCGMSGGVES